MNKEEQQLYDAVLKENEQLRQEVERLKSIIRKNAKISLQQQSMSSKLYDALRE